jgi:hypothetical protein
VNLVLKLIWYLIIWPFFVNPLRHLPQVGVCLPFPISFETG